MTYRDALQQVAQGADPADVLAELGLEAVSPDALSSALRHFAETSPLEVADLLSPFLARTSPVPFEVDDLEPLPEADAILANGGDITDLLSDVGLDPATFDLGPTIDIAGDAVADVIDAAQDAGADADAAPEGDDTFGLGDEQLDSESLDVLEEIGRAGETDGDVGIDELDDFTNELGDVDAGTFSDLIDHIDHVAEAAGIDDLEDTDPLDFDLE